jgi:hypothetical protein
MMKVLTCSRFFPKGHPKAGQETFFVEQVLNLILPRLVNLNDIKPEVRPYVNDFFIIDGERQKHHTIRAGNRFKPGDMVSLRVWSDKPYRSKQVEFAQVEVKKVWPVEIYATEFIFELKIDGVSQTKEGQEWVAINDGLNLIDFYNWFTIHPKKKEQSFVGQIITWSDKINY